MILSSSWYTLWLSNCDNLLQHLRQLFGLARAEFNKHVEHMKPSYTAAYVVLTFDILTRETAFQTEGGVEGGLRYLKKKAYWYNKSVNSE